MITKDRLYLSKSELGSASAKRLRKEIGLLRNELQVFVDATRKPAITVDDDGAVQEAASDVQYLLVESETR